MMLKVIKVLKGTYRITRATNGFRFISQSQNHALPNMQQVIDELVKDLGGQKVWRPDEYNREHLLKIVPNSQEELPPRSMSQSYAEAVIPIGQDEYLREKYISYIGGVRFGRILEDIDIFGVLVCLKYVQNPKKTPDMPSPFCIVTALVDHIDMKGQIVRADQDIKLSGQVSWVGKTSLEATVKLHQLRNNEWEEIITAHIVNVARDPLNRGSAFINPIHIENETQKHIFQQGEENKKRRQQFVDESLLKVPPSAEERAFIHDLYLKTVDAKNHNFKVRVKPDDYTWMEETEMKTVLICHPEARNRYNKIFGGFIMRKAFELAWTNAYITSKTRPLVLHVDDIWFRKPVEIGSILQFVSQVVYTNGPHLQIRVSAEVMDPKTGMHDVTNVFHFTFVTYSKIPAPNILPKTYSDAMLYLDGKRHYDDASMP